MSRKNAHGVVEHTHIVRKADYLFRISIKALIRDPDGSVLVVKESGRDWWDLPGGGMDHEESIQNALARELKEEVGMTGDFEYKIIAVEEPGFLDHANVWQLRLVFLVTPARMNFAPGEDGDAVMFIDPKRLEHSNNSSERKVRAYSLLVSS